MIVNFKVSSLVEVCINLHEHPQLTNNINDSYKSNNNDKNNVIFCNDNNNNIIAMSSIRIIIIEMVR